MSKQIAVNSQGIKILDQIEKNKMNKVEKQHTSFFEENQKEEAVFEAINRLFLEIKKLERNILAILNKQS